MVGAAGLPAWTAPTRAGLGGGRLGGQRRGDLPSDGFAHVGGADCGVQVVDDRRHPVVLLAEHGLCGADSYVGVESLDFFLVDLGGAAFLSKCEN